MYVLCTITITTMIASIVVSSHTTTIGGRTTFTNK